MHQHVDEFRALMDGPRRRHTDVARYTPGVKNRRYRRARAPHPGLDGVEIVFLDQPIHINVNQIEGPAYPQWLNRRGLMCLTVNFCRNNGFPER
jgi:hypothetical protein